MEDRIGAAAADMIREGDTVFLGAGSLSLAVAHHIARKQAVTIVTNALDVATHLAHASTLAVISPGQVERRSGALVGHIAELALQELRGRSGHHLVGGSTYQTALPVTACPKLQCCACHHRHACPR